MIKIFIMIFLMTLSSQSFAFFVNKHKGNSRSLTEKEKNIINAVDTFNKELRAVVDSEQPQAILVKVESSPYVSNVADVLEKRGYKTTQIKSTNIVMVNVSKENIDNEKTRLNYGKFALMVVFGSFLFVMYFIMYNPPRRSY